MALRSADGSVIDQSVFTATTTTSEPTPMFRVNSDVYEDFTFDGSQSKGRRLKYAAGTAITQRQMEDAYAEGTVTSVDPATGPAAGGTSVVVKGTNLDDARGVTIGGTAATDFSVVSGSEIRCTTPAGTAGAHDVVVDLPAGDITAAGAFTYA